MIPIGVVVVSGGMRLLARKMLAVPVVLDACFPVPLRPSHSSCVSFNIGFQYFPKLTFNLCLFARRPSDLHDPSRKDLGCWVEVAPALANGGKELAGIMVIVPALKNVDDGCSQTPDSCWG